MQALLRLRHLPRDARDTLFQLAVIGWTIVPHAVHLAPWCLGLAGLILLARARLAIAGAALPSRWTLLAVLVLAATLTFLDERTLLGKDAGVTMRIARQVAQPAQGRHQTRARAQLHSASLSSAARRWASPWPTPSVSPGSLSP